MKVKAKFIGANGSLGYETGKVYDLDFKTGKSEFPGRSEFIRINNLDTARTPCLYSSLVLFLNNWEVIA